MNNPADFTIRHIPLVNLERIHERIAEEINQSINEVILSNQFINGSAVEKFEKSFAAYCGKKYAVGVASGTDALTLSLIAHGITNAEVIVPTNTFVATALAVKHSGNVPVFVDSDYTGNIDPQDAETKITEKTKAIIPVHLFGQPASMEKLLALAEKYSLICIEDACQAHGASLNNKKMPYGETGCFSFYPTKNIGCFGDGGMIVTDSDKIYAKLKQLRECGAKEKYRHTFHDGFNSRLDTIQAAVLNVKLKKLEEENQLRRDAAQHYYNELSSVSEIKFLELLQGAAHVYHVFAILTAQRDELKKYLEEKGIGVGIHYPIPLHLQEMFKFMAYKQGDFLVAEHFSAHMLALPMYPYLTKEEISYVCTCIKEFFNKGTT